MALGGDSEAAAQANSALGSEESTHSLYLLVERPGLDTAAPSEMTWLY